MQIWKRVFVICLSLFLCGVGHADDWPQWFGPNRDGVWHETEIIEKFPEGGPKVLWKADVNWGYAGPAVADERVIVTDYVKKTGDIRNNPGARDQLTGTERILCFDAVNGKQLWKYEYDRDYSVSYGGGPRCTPSIDNGNVYALGAEGDLVCLTLYGGKEVWKTNLKEQFNAQTPQWGFSAHPLVDGDMLYCMVGGDATVVAFNKLNGEVIWKALDTPEAGYCAPTIIEHGGKRQLIIWDPRDISSLDPKTGEVYWTHPLKPSYEMSIAPPRKWKNYLYAGGIGQVGAMFKLDDNSPKAEIFWKGTAQTGIYGANSTPFLEDGMIYGCDCMVGSLMGAKIEDGQRVWQTYAPTTGKSRNMSAHGSAFMTKNGDRYFLLSETGDLIIAELSPTQYKEIDRAHVIDPTNDAFRRPALWTYPAFANKCMFVRNDKQLICLDLWSK